jgi:hypothetical protein
MCGGQPTARIILRTADRCVNTSVLVDVDAEVHSLRSERLQVPVLAMSPNSISDANETEKLLDNPLEGPQGFPLPRALTFLLIYGLRVWMVRRADLVAPASSRLLAHVEGR